MLPTHKPATNHTPHFTPAEMNALAAFVTTDSTMLLRRADIPADDATLTGLVLRGWIRYKGCHDIYTLYTATLILLARQLHTEHAALTRAHQALRRSLAELAAADLGHGYAYSEAINDLLVAEEEHKSVTDYEEGLIYRLHADGDRTWFVRFADDPETGGERIMVYYKQARDAARYPVADSRDTDALAAPQPHRAGFIAELCRLMTTMDSGADFYDQVYLLLERCGYKDIYDAAYSRAQAEEAQP